MRNKLIFLFLLLVQHFCLEAMHLDKVQPCNTQNLVCTFSEYFQQKANILSIKLGIENFQNEPNKFTVVIWAFMCLANPIKNNKGPSTYFAVFDSLRII